MKLFHAADIHLDSPLHGLERYDGAPVAEMRGATRRAFVNLVDLCIEDGAAMLFLAGDLYDGDWRDFGTGLFFAAQMVRLRDAGVRVFLVRGNHDAASRITKDLHLPDNVYLFSSRKPETVVDEKLGVAVHGQSFARGEITDDLSARYPQAIPGMLNIGMLHTSADGRPGHAAYAPCSTNGLIAKGYQYWALGHVHAREVLHENPWIVFPGNLQGRHIREAGPKGCTVVSVEDGEVALVEERGVDVVRWEHVELDATGSDTSAELLDRLSLSIRSAIQSAGDRFCAVRVRVTGRCRAHAALMNRRESWVADVRALATDVSSGSVWVEKVLVDTAPEIDIARLKGGSGPVAELLRDIDALRQNETRLTELTAKFDDLRAKLPADLKEGDEPLRLDTETIRTMLRDAESLLLPRLLEDEEAP
jgi:DNA repair protein SbcD/Mre11